MNHDKFVEEHPFKWLLGLVLALGSFALAGYILLDTLGTIASVVTHCRGC